MTKRKEWSLRNGDVIYREEHIDGRYGAPGQKRQKRQKPTEEAQRKVNAANKARNCRLRLLEYFNPGDLFVTLTYSVEQRPEDMEAAKKDFQRFSERLGYRYRKKGYTLMWIRNIEKGTRGAWHVHMVVKQTPNMDAAALIQDAWNKGGVYVEKISLSNTLFDEDFTKLSKYMTKDEYYTETKKDGTQGLPKLAESSYSHSKNMPLPEPKPDTLIHWPKKPREKKGYYIANSHEGENPVTGHPYRRYTLIRMRN